MSIQTVVALIVANPNAVVLIMFALTVLLVLKASKRRVLKGRKPSGYNHPRRGFVKVRNDAIGVGSNGNEWRNGSYDGRRDSR